MIPKHLYLLYIFYVFPAQAMQTYKANEAFPKTTEFLIKVLGPQIENKNQKISSVIKMGLPKDLIYNIINEYLGANLHQYPLRDPDGRFVKWAVSTSFDDMLKKINNRDGQDRSKFFLDKKVVIRNKKTKVKIFSNHPVHGRVEYEEEFYTMKKPVIDIDYTTPALEQSKTEILRVENLLALIGFIALFYIMTNVIN